MERLQGIRRRDSRALCQAAVHDQGEGNSLSLDFGGEKTIDHIVLREDIRLGERVRRFIVEGRLPDGKWMALVRGTQIGNRQIVPIRSDCRNRHPPDCPGERGACGDPRVLGLQRQPRRRHSHIVRVNYTCCASVLLRIRPFFSDPPVS